MHAARHLAGLGALLVGLALAPALTTTAYADPAGPWEAASHVTVARLQVYDGRARLVVNAHLESDVYTGFDVEVPAGAGSWSGPTEVAVPGLAARCRLDPGPDLHYRCGRTRNEDAPTALPPGDYQLSVRITRVGDPRGLQGVTRLFAPYGSTGGPDVVTSYAPDAFPVYDDAHWRSRGEVAWARTLTQPLRGRAWRAKVSLHLAAGPGEAIRAAEITLPGAPGTFWDVVEVAGATPDLDCGFRTETGLRCVWSAGVRDARTVTLFLDWSAPSDPAYTPARQSSRLTLSVDDAPAEVVDDFAWRYRESY